MDQQANQITESGGVSRSGRVRKKSARLTEFESAEELPVEVKSSKKKGGSKISSSVAKLSLKSDSMSDFSNDSEDSDFGSKDPDESDEHSWNEGDNSDLLNELQDESKDSINYSQASSLYLSEKKRPANAGVQIPKTNQKAVRKDKGMSRFNAYILWAKEARPEVIEQYPHLDFPAINKKLGDMWSNAPGAQKQVYNRMAKRLSQQGDCPTPTSQMIRTGKMTKRKVVNKGVTKIQQQKGQKEKDNTDSSSNFSKLTSPPHSLHGGTITQRGTPMHKSSALSEQSPSGSAFKVNGTTPIDVSAHLKLLGESLNNIGQKLKENEGQIAVSGSLSVLLDSMLCVLGPLTCLTNQLEETRGAIDDTTLNGILDNIAYIMPGIV